MTENRPTLTSISLMPHEITRLDALRCVMQTSRSNVVTAALTGGGLEALEKQHSYRLRRLSAVARKNGAGIVEFMAAYAAANVRKSYGQTLEQLEEAAGIKPGKPLAA